MKCLLYTILFGTFMSYSQTASIPDIEFEQALIDQNIDSDGMINGEVLTTDINGLLSLNIGTYFISDLTGLEDFEELRKD